MRSTIVLTTAVLALLSPTAALPAGGASRAVVHRQVEEALRSAPDAGQLTVIVRLRGQADLGAFRSGSRLSRRTGVARALLAEAAARQAGVRGLLRQREEAGQVSRVISLWVVNGLSVTGSPAVIRELALRADVAEITPDELDVVPTSLPAGTPETNVAVIGAPDLWSLGFQGAGVVVAILDSGVDVAHPDLAPRYRGGPSDWFDPYGQHATPHDRTGHGTWTAGVIVGGDAGGTSVGVAPGARFIAARIWNDAGSATATAIHAAFQWALDPDGDPTTPDGPDVVNGSWSFGSPGCNLEFQDDLRALRSAGIVPVFAAGNFGPGSRTGVSPANYAEALSVGSVSDAGAIASGSSRGPSACTGAIFPTVVAPGVGVLTTDLYSTWYPVSGTSIAAPHVTGLLALLLGAVPGASGAQAEDALVRTARDLGIAGPDNDFGHGIVAALPAYEALAVTPAPVPVAVADAFVVAGDATTTIPPPGVLENDQDPGGLPLVAILAAAPAHGTVALSSGGGFAYTPAPGFAGSDAFAYRAGNGTGESEVATVSLTVTPSAPVALGDALVLAENAIATVAAPGVLANDSDPAGRPLAAILVGAPQHGTVSLQASGAFTYTPATNFYGVDAFAYQASNGVAASLPATVAITVTFVNQPPVARDDSATTTRGVAVNIPILANDTDVEGPVVASSVAIASSPRNGSVSRKSNGTVTYTPKRTFRGADSFTYTVRDGNGARSNAATVTVQVK